MAESSNSPPGTSSVFSAVRLQRFGLAARFHASNAIAPVEKAPSQIIYVWLGGKELAAEVRIGERGRNEVWRRKFPALNPRPISASTDLGVAPVLAAVEQFLTRLGLLD